MAATEIEIFEETEEERIRSWRRGELMRAGYARSAASRLARTTRRRSAPGDQAPRSRLLARAGASDSPVAGLLGALVPRSAQCPSRVPGRPALPPGGAGLREG